eukprot:TRINITY_DN1834_c0_g1_i1.p1 TRINITY_DN1834_c0_g1~~TRINITY_DN1834_c0_g1_i1.p1  ORF type:complete len:1557 (+),score=427.65 TRINITY_DN1834_c0_g1_i1:84-4673(+)
MASSSSSSSSSPCPLLLLSLIITLFVVATDAGAPLTDSPIKPVDITLKAPWPAYPLQAEISLFLYSHSPHSFWKYLENLPLSENGNGSGASGSVSEEESLRVSLGIAEGLLSQTDMGLLALGLDLHYHNPAIHLHQQLSQSILDELEELQNCTVFVQVGTHFTCDGSQVSQLLDTGSAPESISPTKAFALQEGVDHVYDVFDPALPTVVLYGRVGQALTRGIHGDIVALSASKRFNYIFRHFYSKETVSTLPPLFVQGWGVDLTLKSVEYKVMDESVDGSDNVEEAADSAKKSKSSSSHFHFPSLKEEFPGLLTELAVFESYLKEEPNYDPSLVRLSDLPLKTIASIARSPRPLLALRDISQNFPLLSHVISSQSISEKERDHFYSVAMELAKSRFSHQHSILWVNNIPLRADNLDSFDLYDRLQVQLKLSSAFSSLELPQEAVLQLLSSRSATAPSLRVNFQGEQLYYLNDLRTIENPQFSSNIKDFLEEPHPMVGFHTLSHNIYTVTSVVDPSSKEDLTSVLTLASMLQRGLPLRLSVIFDLRSEEAQAIYSAYSYLVEEFSKSRSPPPENIQFFYTFFGQLLQTAGPSSLLEAVPAILSGLELPITSTSDLPLPSSSSGSIESRLEVFYELKVSSGMLFLNGLLVPPHADPQQQLQSLIQLVQSERDFLVPLIENDIITSDTSDILSVLMSESPNTLPLYDKALMTQLSSDLFLPLPEGVDDSLLSKLSYFHAPFSSDMRKMITHWFVTDFSRVQVCDLLMKMSESTAERSQLLILPLDLSPSKVVEKDSLTLSAAFSALSQFASASRVLPQLVSNCASGDEGVWTLQSVQQIAQSLPGYSISKWEDLLSMNRVVLAELVEAVGGLWEKEEVPFFVSNGKITQLSPSLTTPLSVSFPIIEELELERVSSAVSALEALEIPREQWNVLLLQVQSLVNSIPEWLGSGVLPPPHSEPTFHLPANISENESRTILPIHLLINPLSKSTQLLSSILMELVAHFNVDLSVHLLGETELKEIPLKNFHRDVFSPLEFFEDGSAKPSVAHFGNIPQSELVTTTIKARQNWLVTSHKSSHDLDNIVLDKLPLEEERLSAQFLLESLLVEGSCTDVSTGEHPQGLEVMLKRSDGIVKDDSLVMSTLGYYQLKALPGLFHLSLAGESATGFHIVGPSGTSKLSLPLSVSSFNGGFSTMKVAKNSLLDGEGGADSWGVFDSVLDLFGSSEEESTGQEGEDETIHVFSLASGHLYERFLKIMMLSVVKNTKNPVKFWLLSNFLSPAFKDVAYELAEEFGFEVELVTYRWPQWLREQSEKQRIIWGYKILFLDVLFPLNVKRIIYVDADQVVRADLKELWDLDLEGAPYGLTPFCSGEIMNEETKGFRFWDSGFWKNHLRDRPYHISALYVVDIELLREKGYGDALRGVYHQMSSDPNSLANLDQDLPNYLQHEIPIFSLPSSWLWCQTWCTDESKAEAKTIDLCNNPLTKTPKLEAAISILPEWPGLDAEIQAAEEKIQRLHQSSVSVNGSEGESEGNR